LHCPFCHASEDGRIEAQDEYGANIILVMFKCPFFYRLPAEELIENGILHEENAQGILDEWKETSGEQWLQSIGPILQDRERKNMEGHRNSFSRKST
jgi:hypothetical protein